MFRYRLHSPDGDDLGEATYAQMIHLGDEIQLGAEMMGRVALDFERDALTVKGDLSKRISLSMTQPAPQRCLCIPPRFSRLAGGRLGFAAPPGRPRVSCSSRAKRLAPFNETAPPWQAST
jgi:hypothetical protein